MFGTDSVRKGAQRQCSEQMFGTDVRNRPPAPGGGDIRRGGGGGSKPGWDLRLLIENKDSLFPYVRNRQCSEQMFGTEKRKTED